MDIADTKSAARRRSTDKNISKHSHINQGRHYHSASGDLTAIIALEAAYRTGAERTREKESHTPGEFTSHVDRADY